MRRALVPDFDSTASMPSTHASIVGPLVDVNSPRFKTEYGRLYYRCFAATYAFLRRTGVSRRRAPDMTQDFWVAGLDGRHFRGYERSRGRFSVWLRIKLQRWRDGEHRKWRRQPDRKPISLSEDDPDFVDREVQGLEKRLADPQAVDPNKEMDRALALEVLRAGVEAVASRLEARNAKANLVILREYIFATDSQRPNPGTLAAELGLSKSVFFVRVQRLEKAVAKAVKDELRLTLREGDSIEEEIDRLHRALQSPRRSSPKRTAEDDLSDHLSDMGDGDR